MGWPIAIVFSIALFVVLEIRMIWSLRDLERSREEEVEE